MAHKYRTYGPFEIDLDDRNRLPDDMTNFWNSLNEEFSGLSGTKGIYIFGLSSSGGSTIYPWYVGKTNKQNFENECFKPHQRTHYCHSLAGYVRVKAYLYLIARHTENGAWSKSSAGEDISFLERFFIGAALKANAGLRNKKDTKIYAQLSLLGFFNSSGRLDESTKRLRQTLKMGE